MKKFSLSKNERIKQKKIFDELFKSGKVILSKDNSLKSVYLIKKTDYPGVKISVGVSKKAGKAFWRNRLKRLIRNAYRLNKLELVELAFKKKITIFILFLSISLNQSTSKKLFYKNIEKEIIFLLQKINKTIHSL